MPSAVAYSIAIAIGAAVGVAAIVDFHRRHPNYRDAPSFKNTLWAARQAVWINCVCLPVFALLAWALGDLNAWSIAVWGAFLGVQIAGLFVWPILRARRKL